MVLPLLLLPLFVVGAFAQGLNDELPPGVDPNAIVINIDEDYDDLPPAIRALIGSSPYGRPLRSGEYDLPEYGGVGPDEVFENGTVFGIEYDPRNDVIDDNGDDMPSISSPSTGDPDPVDSSDDVFDISRFIAGLSDDDDDDDDDDGDDGSRDSIRTESTVDSSDDFSVDISRYIAGLDDDDDDRDDDDRDDDDDDDDDERRDLTRTESTTDSDDMEIDLRQFGIYLDDDEDDDDEEDSSTSTDSSEGRSETLTGDTDDDDDDDEDDDDDFDLSRFIAEIESESPDSEDRSVDSPDSDDRNDDYEQDDDIDDISDILAQFGIRLDGDEPRREAASRVEESHLGGNGGDIINRTDASGTEVMVESEVVGSGERNGMLQSSEAADPATSSSWADIVALDSDLSVIDLSMFGIDLDDDDDDDMTASNPIETPGEMTQAETGQEDPGTQELDLSQFGVGPSVEQSAPVDAPVEQSAPIDAPPPTLSEYIVPGVIRTPIENTPTVPVMSEQPSDNNLDPIIPYSVAPPDEFPMVPSSGDPTMPVESKINLSDLGIDFKSISSIISHPIDSKSTPFDVSSVDHPVLLDVISGGKSPKLPIDVATARIPGTFTKPPGLNPHAPNIEAAVEYSTYPETSLQQHPLVPGFDTIETKSHIPDLSPFLP